MKDVDVSVVVLARDQVERAFIIYHISKELVLYPWKLVLAIPIQ